MANRFLTQKEVLKEIGLPILRAVAADLRVGGSRIFRNPVPGCLPIMVSKDISPKQFDEAIDRLEAEIEALP